MRAPRNYYSEGKPDIVPIGFKFVDRVSYIFFDRDYGRKAENIFRNPQVCFEVTELVPPDAIRRDQKLKGHDSVIILGKCEKVAEKAAQIRIYGEAIFKRARERGGGFAYKIWVEEITSKTFRMKTA